MRRGSGGKGIARRIRAGLAGALAAAGTTSAADGAPGFSLAVDLGPALYRYEESGTGPFEGLETEWEDAALLVRTEGAWRRPLSGWMGEAEPVLRAFVRFHFLTSAEDTETNNVGASTTDLRIAYLFGLEPGVQLPFRWFPGVTVAPEVAWDLDWYLQSRELSGGGRVDEAVFRHGPATGARLTWEPAPAWAFDLAYRHSFLIHVNVSNTFAEGLGFGDLETDGQRDVAELFLTRRFGPRWSARLGYRFEIARIDASDAVARTIQGADGPQVVEVQFPENEHRIHALLLSLLLSF